LKQAILPASDYDDEYQGLEYPDLTPSDDLSADTAEVEVEEEVADVKLSPLVSVESEQAEEFGIFPRRLNKDDDDDSIGNKIGESNPFSDERYLIVPTAAAAAAAAGAAAAGGAAAAASATSNSCNVCFGSGSTTAATAAACDANSVATVCEAGDVCLLEMRKNRGEIVELRTMCKGDVIISNIISPF